jgi:hypothetical protein
LRTLNFAFLDLRLAAIIDKHCDNKIRAKKPCIIDYHYNKIRALDTTAAIITVVRANAVSRKDINYLFRIDEDLSSVYIIFDNVLRLRESEERQIEAVTRYGMALEYIPNPSPRVYAALYKNRK